MLNSTCVWGCDVNILEEAESIIYGDREQTYGKPGVNLERIAGQWALYLQQKFGAEANLTAEDVCWMMVDLKKCRQMNADKRDNLVDAAGYLALIERAADGSKESESNSKVDPLVALCLREKTASAREQQANAEHKAAARRLAEQVAMSGGKIPFRESACNYYWPTPQNHDICGRCGFPDSAHRATFTSRMRPFPAPLHTKE